MTKPKPILWPKYIEKKFKTQTLAAFVAPDVIITEQGDHLSASDPTSLILHIFDKNLLLYIRKFPDIPYLQDLWKLARDIWCDEFGVVRCIIFQGERRTTRMLVAIESWGYLVPTVEVLKELRVTQNYLNVGTPSTPGAAGQALMRYAWKLWYGRAWPEHRHRRPPCPAIDDLRNHAPGPRIEVFSKLVYKKSWEIDMKNAYANFFRQVITGICSRTYKESCLQHLVYFTEVQVTIKTPLPIGFFPIKKDEGVTYPRDLGVYSVWLWSMQVQFAEKYLSNYTQIDYTGCGWGWDEMTNDTECYTLLYEWLRDFVKVAFEKDPKMLEIVEKHVKTVGQAGIGRFNLPDVHYQIVDEGELGVDKPVVSDGSAYNWWIHKTLEQRPTSMPHWFYFVVACCNVAVTRLALEYCQHLIAIRTDAVVLDFEADVNCFIDKDTEESIDSGVWCKQLLTNVNIPHKGDLLSDQKIKLQGVRHGDRVNKSIDALREQYG
jgi:hypothetical protein